MLAPVFYILPLGTVTRTRTLPHTGRVLVRVGQKVSPSDIIAETSFSRKHVIIDLAEQLQVASAKLDSFVKVKRGQKVSKGDVIAEAGGVFGREVRAPVDGRVAALAGGKLVMETSRSSIEIRAGLAGTVTEVVENRGAIIRASGAIVQGVWGNGKADAGVLLSLIEKPDDMLEASRLDVSLRGSVILAGHVSDPKTLKNAAELPVRGLILSSMSPALLSIAKQMPYPILLLDGFGRRPMNSAAFKLLSTNVKRDIAINAEVCNRVMGTRPEVFMPLPFNQEPPEPPTIEGFASGQTVRIISMLQPARIGTLIHMPEELVKLPSGVRAMAAQVRLESGDEIFVPLSNLEVLG
jgi:biotin carboxyl carrier protein